MQARKRGLSARKLRNCVAIDVHKNPVAVVCGRGKPSSALVREAMGGRIEPGLLLLHDKERANGALVREGGLVDEPHKADINDPVCLERMEIVNDLYSWLERYLRRFDVAPLIKDGTVFSFLTDGDAFSRAYIDEDGSIARDRDPSVDSRAVWSNKVDLSPESCYVHGVPV